MSELLLASLINAAWMLLYFLAAKFGFDHGGFWGLVVVTLLTALVMTAVSAITSAVADTVKPRGYR